VYGSTANLARPALCQNIVSGEQDVTTT
jgi:hypothetical protein